MKHQFSLEYWQDGEWLVGRLKEGPRVFSQGHSRQELEANIDDAYRLIADFGAQPPSHAQVKPLLLDVA